MLININPNKKSIKIFNFIHYKNILKKSQIII
jgi:hypothetical protein